MQEPKSVGLWIRVSTDGQVKDESPDRHEQRARGYVEAKAWVARTVYRLDAVSGKSVKDHAETKRMLRDVASGTITALVFSNLSRLARNTRELLEFADHFKTHNADLVSLAEAIDTSTPAGRMFFTVKAALVTWEREEIASRVAASIPIRAKLGKPLGGAAPYGYRWQDKKLVADATEAPIRRLIHELYEQSGFRAKTTARLLNERGLRTRRGGLWGASTVSWLIKDPTAKGRHRANYQRMAADGSGPALKPDAEWVWHDVEPIVSAEVWERCNRAFSGRKRGEAVPSRVARHLFTGLIHCHCGARMYVPWRRLKYACTVCKIRIPADDIEAVFRERLRGLTVDQEEIGRCLDASDKQLNAKSSVLASMTSEESSLSADMEKLLDLYLTGGISKAAFSARHGPMEQRRDQLRDELARAQGELDAMRIGHADRDAILESLGDLHEQWPNLDAAEKRQIVEALIDKITIAPGEIELELAIRPLRSETGLVCASTSAATATHEARTNGWATQIRRTSKRRST